MARSLAWIQVAVGGKMRRPCGHISAGSKTLAEQGGATVAVKVTDMLGEEVITSRGHKTMDFI